jgi:acyl carrier protein
MAVRQRAANQGAPVTDKIREVLAAHGRLSIDAAGLRDGDDLFRLGMTSHASVSVMLGLEEAYGIEFPEHLLRKSTFASVAAIQRAIDELTTPPTSTGGAPT